MQRKLLLFHLENADDRPGSTLLIDCTEDEMSFCMVIL
jgi:hypothetical protein